MGRQSGQADFGFELSLHDGCGGRAACWRENGEDIEFAGMLCAYVSGGMWKERKGGAGVIGVGEMSGNEDEGGWLKEAG